MKSFLIIGQVMYALCLAPWLLVWGLSFMGFDQGFSLFNIALVAGIGLYPVALIACSILAWKLRKRKKKIAVLLNLVPLVWILGVGIPVFFT
ncbi:hypothetical protein ACFPPD_10555 [Cohnella suwonensis]|uniref:Uncharacterized protein n=1 Tax=Cohnella suwonensis TaxID=696072 RepID=A0ABW0LWR3_9BACL